MKKNQQGMTFIGVMFVGMVVVFGAILAMKLIPPYLEFWSVRQIITGLAKDPGLPEMTPAEIRSVFERRAVIDNIKAITEKDLDISRDSGEMVVTASYSVTVPIVANLSALIEFNASTQGTKVVKRAEG